MPSEPPEPWPSADQSLADAARSVSPEVDGPPRRTSSRTPAAVAAGAVPFLLLGLLGFWLAIPIAVVLLVRGVVSWWFRTYTVGATELVIDEGIFTRRRQVVPYDRVQQVDTRQSIVPRLFGVSELRIGTAAGAGTENARLAYLEAERAEGLRSYILVRREQLQHRIEPAAEPGAETGRPRAEPIAPLEGEVLLALAPGRLALASVTHGSILVGASGGFLVGLWVGAFVGVGAPARPVVLLGGGLAAALVVATFSAGVVIVRNLIERYGFTVGIRGDDIQLRYGMLELRDLTIPRRRVQQVTVVDNPIRRWLGLVSLELHSATAGGDVTSFEVPLLDRDDLDSFLTRIMGTDAWTPPETTGRNARARARGVRRRCLGLAILVAPPAIALYPFGLALLGLAALGVPWGRVAHRRAGHGLSPTLVGLRRGVFRHHLDLVPLARVQSSRTRASPFQRHARLTTYSVDVAGGDAPRLYDMDQEIATDLMRDLPRRSGPTPLAASGVRPGDATEAPSPEPGR